MGAVRGESRGTWRHPSPPANPLPFTILARISPLLSVLGGGIQKGHLGLVASTQAGNRRMNLPQIPGPMSLPRSLPRGLGQPWGRAAMLGLMGIGCSGSCPFLYLIGTAKRPFSKQPRGAEIPTESNASITSGGENKIQCYKELENPCLDSLWSPAPYTDERWID